MEENKKKALAEEASANILGPNPVIGLNRKSIVNTLKTLTLKTVTNPLTTAKHQVNLLKEFTNIARGKSELQPNARDKRFKDPAWKENAFYKNSMQAYLAITKEMTDWVEDLGMEQIDADRAKFVASLLTEAIAPSNWVTNPSSLKRVIETGGKSWAKGIGNFLKDLVNNGGMPSQFDPEGFKVGENLACTPGKVVYKNHILELIQYSPQTEKVRTRPLLMIPPQINKYYVFDLAPGRSLVEYLVQEGIQVFLASWRNPTKNESMWDLEMYVTALEESIDIIKNICRVKDINVWGACSGGITMATTLAYLAAKGNNCVNAFSLIVAMLDMSNATDTTAGLFTDNDAIELARERSHRRGILKGNEMASIFAWMRPNDLIWNYWVNNYLHGNKPPKFDILYWNGDTTNLAACLHSDYLDLFKENLLAKKGGFKIGEFPIDLSKVKGDVHCTAGITDHLTPWKVCYQSINLFKAANPTFVLTNRGHIQTIVNPVGNPKGKYYTNEEDSYLPGEPDQWLAGASEHQGSYWPHYSNWLKERSGKLKNAPQKMGNKQYEPMYDAPGKYVLD